MALASWADERYVRVYTQDTGDWLGLSFEAQALFVLLLRKADTAGEVHLGKRGKASVGTLVGHPDRPGLEPALDELLRHGFADLRDEGQVVVVAQKSSSALTRMKRAQPARPQVSPSRR